MELLLLPDDVLLHIFQYLNNYADLLALVYTCTRLQQLCQHRPIIKKVDLTLEYRETLQDATKNFFQDKLMAQHITKLHLNFCLDILININLEEFVIASCPLLRVLHVIDCGISFRSLHRILRNADSLTTLSWSMVELSVEDFQFMVQDATCNNGIRLENIKNLKIHTAFSKLHADILRYLLLCRCKCIEKIVITFSEELDLPYDEWNYMYFPGKPSSEIDILQQLHSLHVFSRSLKKKFERFPEYDDNLTHFGDILVLLQLKKRAGTKKWKKIMLQRPLDCLL